jgi:hypothetical protein
LPITEGWEVSPDRIKMYEKIISSYPIGDPILTSKCKLDNENGLLVASNNGFAWRLKMGMSSSYMSAGKSKWIRWHDINNIIPKKNGQVLVEIKLRKQGSLILDKKGNYKLKKWKLTIKPSKAEEKSNWMQRLANFNNFMMSIYNQNKIDTDPPTSDSVI